MERTARSLNNKLIALETEAQGVKGITYDRDRVQTSPTNRMEDLVPRLAAVRAQYQAILADYHEAIVTRTRQIMEIGRDDYAEILRIRYIETHGDGTRYKLDEIADMMSISFDRARHLHGEALQAFGRKYL